MKKTLTIEGTPVSKGRLRTNRNGHRWTPTKTRDAEFNIKQQAKYVTVIPIEKDLPVELRVDFYFTIPKSWSKKKKELHMCQYKTSKPDLDNLVKLVKDALNGIAWHDDSQVVRIVATKRYSISARTEIEIDILEMNN